MLDATKGVTKWYGSQFFDIAKYAVKPLIMPLKLYEEVKAGRRSYSSAAAVGLIIPFATCIHFLLAVVAASLLIASMFILYPMGLFMDAHGIALDDSSHLDFPTI